MRTKYYFVIIACMLFVTNLYAQDPASFDYFIDIQTHLKGTGTSNDAECDSHVTITAVFEDNTEAEIINMPLNGLPGGTTVDWGSGWSTTFNSADQKIVRLKAYAIRKGFDIPFGCRKQYEATVEIPIQDLYPCAINADFPGVFHDGGYSDNSFLRVTIHPKYSTEHIRLTSSENTIGDRDSITINGPAKDWANSSNFYNWQYQVQGEATWNSFPARYINQESVTLDATELFEGTSYNVDQLAGKNIFVRIAQCSGSADPLSLQLRKSAPKVRQVSVTNTTCSYQSDGTYKVWFDRSLIPGESLIAELRDSTHAGVSYPVQIMGLAADNSYMFTDLAAARYYFFYQSRINLNNNPQQSVPVWANTTGDVISAPAPVIFATIETSVNCYGGGDGTSTITASGGNNSFRYMFKRQSGPDSAWYNFNSGNSTAITGLGKDNYIIQVKDANGCTGTSANQPSKLISITQPAAPLVIQLVNKADPAAFGSTNGYIEVDVAGGTPDAAGAYHYQWQDQRTNTVITSNITTSVVSSGYRIRLSGLGEGTYSLEITDSRYSAAVTPAGCTMARLYTLVQPDPLIAAIGVQDNVRCHAEANGALVAHGKGGITFPAPGNPYHYTWKKKDAANTWQVLPGYTDSVAAGLTAGWYAVNITDANNISLAADTIFQLAEPDPMQLTLTKTDVTCTGMNNGAIDAVVAGGNGGYTYEWSTGETQSRISALAAGSYFLFVKDNKGCETEGHEQVQEGVTITLSAATHDPTCHNGTDGTVMVNVGGGTAPYTYFWTNTTATTAAATGLSAGTYTVKAMDVNGCFVEHTAQLQNPASLSVQLGPDRYICINQTISYDITVPQPATYQWKSADGTYSSNQPAVTLDRAGKYIAAITDINGCPGDADTVVLTYSNTVLNVAMAIPSQALKNQEIVAVNVSNPAPESIEWQLPAQAQVISRDINQARFSFSASGTYNIGIKAAAGGCYDYRWKPIVISDRSIPSGSTGNDNNSFIKSFVVAPNPVTDNFKITVELRENAGILLTLYDMRNNGQKVATLPRQAGSNKYTISLNRNTLNLSTGVYSLMLETDKGNIQTVKLIVL